MSDNVEGADPGSQAGVQGQGGGAASAGTLLREAREAAGLHIAALAVALKVPVRKLEALEADRLDLLPDAVFVRALASSVCRTLKVDPQPVLERLPQTATPRLTHDQGGINTPFRTTADGPSPSWLDQMSKPVFLAVFALLLGALVLILLPQMQRDEAKAVLVPEPASVPVQVSSGAEEAASAAAAAANLLPPSQAPGAAPAVPATAVASAPRAAQGVTMAMPPAVASSVPAIAAARMSATFSVASSTPTVVSPTHVITPGAAAAAARASSPSVPSVPVVKASAPSPSKAATTTLAAASAARPAASAAPPTPTTGIVVFKAKGESWIEVMDAKRTIVLRKTLAAGETAGASGALPLSVTVGRANSTEVQVRGQAFDLAPLAKDNVARFEVK